VRIFGVPVRLHFTFVLLLVFLVIAGIGGRYSDRLQILSVLGLFASVLLHELGHSVVSRLFGVKVREIVMYPIGGLSRLEKQPGPRQELWIGVAGPAVNLALAGAIFLAQAPRASVMGQIAMGNLMLGLFNLLPAFPMDGGRILRSLLALFKPETTATRIAAGTGKFFAIGMGLYGLLTGNYFLVFIAVFVYLGAAQEGTVATGRVLVRGTPVRAAMVTEFHTLTPGNTIRDAADRLLATSQQDFPVALGEQVLGVLGRQALLKAMAESGPDSYVAGAMQRDFVQVPPEMDLAEALPLLAQAGHCALVMDRGKLLGLLTGENLAEFVLLRKSGLEA
jgi:Zn-dependent protease/CBS domain-containing protein